MAQLQGIGNVVRNSVIGTVRGTRALASIILFLLLVTPASAQPATERYAPAQLAEPGAIPERPLG